MCTYIIYVYYELTLLVSDQEVSANILSEFSRVSPSIFCTQLLHSLSRSLVQSRHCDGVTFERGTVMSRDDVIVSGRGHVTT